MFKLEIDKNPLRFENDLITRDVTGKAIDALREFIPEKYINQVEEFCNIVDTKLNAGTRSIFAYFNIKEDDFSFSGMITFRYVPESHIDLVRSAAFILRSHTRGDIIIENAKQLKVMFNDVEVARQAIKELYFICRGTKPMGLDEFTGTMVEECCGNYHYKDIKVELKDGFILVTGI